MREPIPSLTGLRFVAALCVVLGHAIPKIVPFNQPPRLVVMLSALSGEGMSLFFVLSGFVIYYNYSDTIRGAAGNYNFIVARFARLYPLYFACMCYDLLLSFSYDRLPAMRIALPYYATLTQSWVYRPIGGNALIYQFGRIAQITWSISTEWFFYIVFPLACIAISRLTTLGRMLWAAAGLISIAVAISATLSAHSDAILTFGLNTFGEVGANEQDSFYRWLMYFSPYARIFEFLIGCLCAAIYLKLKTSASPNEERCGAWATAAAILTIGALHWAMFGIDSDAPWHHILQGMHMNFGFAPFLAVLVFCCARYRNAFVRFMATPTLMLCGEASYSLYLLHVVVIDAFSYEAAKISRWVPMLIAVARLIVVIATAIGLSLVSWAVIEVPARRWIRRLMSVSIQRPAAERLRTSGQA
jgi:peptidoglycan/LPS O-acetylase OafA/YrhL